MPSCLGTTFLTAICISPINHLTPFGSQNSGEPKSRHYGKNNTFGHREPVHPKEYLCATASLTARNTLSRFSFLSLKLELKLKQTLFSSESLETRIFKMSPMASMFLQRQLIMARSHSGSFFNKELFFSFVQHCFGTQGGETSRLSNFINLSTPSLAAWHWEWNSWLLDYPFGTWLSSCCTWQSFQTDNMPLRMNVSRAF